MTTCDDKSKIQATSNVAEKLKRAVDLHRKGMLLEAKRLYEDLLREEPNDFNALHLFGVLAIQSGQSQAGVASITRAIELNSSLVDAHNSLGNGLRELGRPLEALASYDRALSLKPDYAEAHNNRGTALRDLQRYEEEIAAYERAIRLKPDYAAAHNNRGAVLYRLRRYEDALLSSDRALELQPDFAGAHSNRGTALSALGHLGEALVSYEKAIALNPSYAEAFSNRGNVLHKLAQNEQALASYDQAIALRPNFTEAYANRGNALRDLNRPLEALASYKAAHILKPSYEFLLGDILYSKLKICDWTSLREQISDVQDKVARGEKTSQPLPLMMVTNSPDLLKTAATTWVYFAYPMEVGFPPISKHPKHNKIRLGYFSADFREHPTAHLTAELFEQHDRTRFEITAFSFGPPTQDRLRERLRAAFDRFIDVENQSDREIALLSRQLEIDVAIDLGGLTKGARTGIFALRAAPVQVNYLAFPGTMGASYIDYVIGDQIVIPDSHQNYFSERVVYLPNSYFVYDTTHRTALAKSMTRAEYGLPDDAFVFCCFNHSAKISAETFDSWAKILGTIDHSVLWLLRDNTAATINLQREMQARGVSSDRLIFSDRLPVRQHLARHRLADLFLDTLPYGAHTTAIDALWAGLPVLTCVGDTFPGRVAASLLNAIELPELITSSRDAYESLATELANSPTRLGSLRKKLETNRCTTALFDTKSFARHMESAYTQMYNRWQNDLRPEHIYVPNL
jgi:predicted O-linked N-acetylglucosamine transferase (SPINDLY family)